MPLTVTEVLSEAGFSKVEILKNLGAAYTIQRLNRNSALIDSLYAKQKDYLAWLMMR